jgi:4-aminobutyrate aminotransferase-like enzyme/Ser/Thr protein kinase RdoA (MazF antagonist)
MSLSSIAISIDEASHIAQTIYGKVGQVSQLAGEIDFNFFIKTTTSSFVLKVSRPDVDISYLDFQDKLHLHLECQNISELTLPIVHRGVGGCGIFDYIDSHNRVRKIRMLHWIDGALLSSVKSKDEYLMYSLGNVGGMVSTALKSFEHHYGFRQFDWDLNQAIWTIDYHYLFNQGQLEIVNYFTDRYRKDQASYGNLPKSIIHNDANDNNILIRYDAYNTNVVSIIDYGDAIYSQTINDLAVCCAYAAMDCNDPLAVICDIVRGYHQSHPFGEDEYHHLYTLIAMRLVVSVTKSAINKVKEPDNHYLQISETSAWNLLQKLITIDPHFATYNIRKAAGFVPCPAYQLFKRYGQNHQWHINELVQYDSDKSLQHLDLSIGSTFLGNYSNFIESEEYSNEIITLLQQEDIVLIGGYGEARPIYTTDAYKVVKNVGYEHRTIHMGIDVWTSAGSPVFAIEDAIIYSIYNNEGNKDYGPTVILQHEIDDLIFFTLYGHLDKVTLSLHKVGDSVSKGTIIGYLGIQEENGNWAPHLHFQIILDMLDCKHDFYGVASPSLWPIYQYICPDPNLLFKLDVLEHIDNLSMKSIIDHRKKHLGRSLSLSYKEPLLIIRGQMQYLIDHLGQKYLDTVNNVAHVGHENPQIIKAGIEQMNLLNTNTRYLHPEIIAFAQELLDTFSPELSVVHFVNSGSEANELALRMAKTITNQKDIIALEVGYHGNTQACIDISSYKFDGKGGHGRPAHTHLVPLPDTYRGRYTDHEAAHLYASHLDHIIDMLSHSGTKPAAFIAESIVSCGGQIPLSKEFLQAAYQKVRAAGGLCIADEVQVGFGRVGKKFWGYELYDVVPDIVTLGKPIGNGHPLGAVVCTARVADAFANGMEYFNTFGGNPVSCAIGRSVLNNIKTNRLQNHAFQLGEYMKLRLQELLSSFSFLADVRGEGLFLGIEFVDKNKQPLPQLTSFVANKMKEYKVLMSIDGPQENVLKIKPPMCITKLDIDYILDSLSQILKDIPHV